MSSIDRKRPILILIVLLLLSLACGSSNTGTVVTPAPANETDPESSVDENDEEGAGAFDEGAAESTAGTSLDTFEVGDLVEVQDQTIRLNSVEYQGTVLVANFTIENLGTSDLAVSSVISFSAKKSDGTLLDQEYFSCGTSSLNGSVLPGDLLRGDVCWTGAKPEDGIRIYYEASLFGQGAIVWNAIEGTAPDLDQSGTQPEVQIFALGEIVEVQSQTIRLNSIEYQGNVLLADFTIDNLGDSDIDMSSMLSITAKKSDGTLLEQEIFDCGPSSLDGKILPGDRLRGAICWSGASPDAGIRIYYEASFLGQGAIVWDAIPGEAEPLEITEPQLKVDVFSLGELIQLQGHTITLNTVEFQGNVLKANFTVENQGTEDLNISSLLLFYVRTWDGSELEQEFFSCGTSMDGSVIPGDKLTGDICWSGADPADGLRIYYEANFFSEGAVVWVLEN